MAFRLLDHTADLAVEIVADSRSALFEQAAIAMCHCITDVGGVVPLVGRTAQLSAPDLESLLVQWLEELLYLFETEGLLFSRAGVVLEDSALGDVSLHAELLGQPFDAGRHPLETAIKAVTYHALEISRSGEDWRARVIFDI